MLSGFFKDILKYDLIPSREAILDKTPVAFEGKKEMWLAASRKTKTLPYGVLNAVHGIPTHWYQYVPDNPRVGLVPILPLHATSTHKSLFNEVVDPYAFHSPEQAANYVQVLYPRTKFEPAPRQGRIGKGTTHVNDPIVPEQRHQAFRVLYGNTGIILNSEEFKHKAGPQYYNLTLDKGPVDAIDGAVRYHQYLMLKQEPDRLFIHANNYSQKKTSIRLLGNQTLKVTTEPADALVKQTWDAKHEEMTLTVSHMHKESVVRIFVE